MIKLEVPVSFAEFARILGVNRSYVTKLKKNKLLVLTSDGKKVLPEQSKALIDKNKDHSKVRKPQPEDATATPAAPQQEAGGGVNRSYSESRAAKEHFFALKAEQDYNERMRLLIERERAVAAIADIMAFVRSRMLALPASIGPQLSTSDESGNIVALTIAVEEVLSGAAAELQQKKDLL